MHAIPFLWIPPMTNSLVIIGFKILFADEANGASPVIGQVLEGNASGDIVLRVTQCGVINPVANGASILLHGVVDFGVTLL